VPLDTVVSISVYPKNPPKLAGLKLDVSKYEKKRDVHVESIYYYINTEEGINFTVEVGEGLVTGIEYYPSAKDNHLRCQPGKDVTGGINTTSKFGEYAGNPAVEKRKLDKFAAFLRRHAANQGYVLVYAARRSRLNEAELIARRIKNYLVKGKGLDPRQIVTLAGGRRRQLTVELYIVPTGATPPLP
jgi:hypothetical protein